MYWKKWILITLCSFFLWATTNTALSDTYQTLRNAHNLTETDIEPLRYYHLIDEIELLRIEFDSKKIDTKLYQENIDSIHNTFGLFPPAVQKVIISELSKIVITDKLTNERGRYEYHKDNLKGYGIVRINSINPPTTLKGRIVLVHEFGHVLDDATDRSQSVHWLSIIRKGNPITLYALERPNEYFAEAVALYIFSPQKLYELNMRIYDFIAFTFDELEIIYTQRSN